MLKPLEALLPWKLDGTTDNRTTTNNRQQTHRYWGQFSKKLLCRFVTKNPAYGRQSISWPMRIVAPIPKNPASKAKVVENQTFFARRFYTLYEQKYSNLRPLLSISLPQGFGKSKNFGHWTLGSGGEKTFKWSEQRKKKIQKKNFFRRSNFRHFLSKNVHIWDPFSPLLFPKDSESLIFLYIWLRELGAKRCLNCTSKVNKF